MSEPRIKADIWIKALIRRAQVAGAFAAVVRRGDDTAGSLLLKINKLDGQATVYVPGYNFDGQRVWRRHNKDGATPEAEADLYIEKSVARDPDIWVVEVEDREGRTFLDEPIEEA
ncbi:MAG: DUF1491 family protein [Alphaproteobacteria bacterium]|nr:DUF1491 family protein [Alphaproteobacteria bacterium]MBT4017265.1 DUF1491 family protein [Alphaproteobacteria bacterium]MBT4966652.1 DUF1491 family protein [Alphaproteobacteria bacterium]MBT5158407.1 DUF1491 family protein [Alphaproteobacteria bacterium]MBT5918021.1 DUF1491 family protein [Alphaproteobacteria bacterium]